MTQNDDRKGSQLAGNTDTDGKHEPTNVELQFMGHVDPNEELEELDAKVKAESREADSYKERGMDKQDVASAQSMDGSDPPSTNMGDADEEMTP
ncbi:M-like protein [Deinococcus arenicola]|uniref:M-like protein n=1 Tax=Deinococcus arenicola TaxID=2994950 RepID=A0ABU4DV01_9DEIO|nr:M-like protein [Deinococcus sp. ZS9-10]MDV6375710.1 M-like protein [Deinococcus sp. ZS9-10]